MISEALDEIKKIAAKAANELRKRAPEMTGTEIIAEEEYIPRWNGEKDYSSLSAGTPVEYDGQIYLLIQPHNAKNYPYAPNELLALWRVAHTKDPKKAKPFVKPTGTSDMYLKDECAFWEDGKTYKALRDTVYSPKEHSADWEEI